MVAAAGKETVETLSGKKNLAPAPTAILAALRLTSFGIT